MKSSPSPQETGWPATSLTCSWVWGKGSPRGTLSCSASCESCTSWQVDQHDTSVTPYRLKMAVQFPGLLQRARAFLLGHGSPPRARTRSWEFSPKETILKSNWFYIFRNCRMGADQALPKSKVWILCRPRLVMRDGVAWITVGLGSEASSSASWAGDDLAARGNIRRVAPLDRATNISTTLGSNVGAAACRIMSPLPTPNLDLWKRQTKLI